MCAEMSLESQG